MLSDTLNGGQGDDQLFGGGGSDLYRFVAGEGYDSISDTGGTADVLDFGATAIGAATFWQEGNDLLVQLRGSDSGVRVKDQFLATATSQIESFAFNGTQYGQADVASRIVPLPTEGARNSNGFPILG
jgi:Ca2+-binding RTX toxin-like protein